MCHRNRYWSLQQNRSCSELYWSWRWPVTDPPGPGFSGFVCRDTAQPSLSHSSKMSWCIFRSQIAISEYFHKYLNFRLICYWYKLRESCEIVTNNMISPRLSTCHWHICVSVSGASFHTESRQENVVISLGENCQGSSLTDSHILWQSAAWLWADLEIYGLAQIVIKLGTACVMSW